MITIIGELTELAYQSYRNSTGGQNGEHDMPDTLSDCGVKVATAWRSAVRDVVEKVKEDMAGGLIEVTIKADIGDGNDPLEATTRLHPATLNCERLEVWVNRGRRDNSDVAYLEVHEISVSTYWPNDISIWVSTDGIPDDEVHLIFESIEKNAQP